MRDGLPRWRWRVGDVVLERELAFRHGASALSVVHTLISGGPVGLAIEPLCNWRDAHGERHAAGGLVDPLDEVIRRHGSRPGGPGRVAS